MDFIKYNMDNYEIIGWPEIQYIMDEPGFRENSALIDINENIGIGSSTYLVSKGWLKEINYIE